MKSGTASNRKECSHIFCDKVATRKVKFRRDPMLDLDQEIVYFCKEHAQEKKQDDSIRTMWVAIV